MSYSIQTIPQFDKQLKRLVKKYPSFKDDFVALIESLRENRLQGTPIGKNCYKVRVSITSKGKGKSGGARVITNFVVVVNALFLIAIYDKSEKENISDKELDELLKNVPE